MNMNKVKVIIYRKRSLKYFCGQRSSIESVTGGYLWAYGNRNK